jgi:hypothetical protein
MRKLSFTLFILPVFFFLSSSSFAQADALNVIHLQTWKLNTIPMGDDATAFAEMLQRQTDAVSGDSRLLSFRVVRHNWGADSRDMVMIAEFKNKEDLFSFYDDLNAMLEKAFSKEQMEKDNALFGKYAGQHSDEIYQVIAGTK